MLAADSGRGEGPWKCSLLCGLRPSQTEATTALSVSQLSVFAVRYRVLPRNFKRWLRKGSIPHSLKPRFLPPSMFQFFIPVESMSAILAVAVGRDALTVWCKVECSTDYNSSTLVFPTSTGACGPWMIFPWGPLSARTLDMFTLKCLQRR